MAVKARFVVSDLQGQPTTDDAYHKNRLRQANMKRIFFIFLFFFFSTIRNPQSAISNQENSRLGQKQRLISLAPSTTEILFALGLGDEVIGISSFCNFPPQANAKERIGTFSQPNMEKIIHLKPDIIFCTGLEQGPAIERLKMLNLNVYVSDPTNINELLDSIRDIARITNKEREGEGLIKDITKAIGEVQDKVKLIPPGQRPKVLIEIWHSPLMVAGKHSFIDELVTLAGGLNIAYDTPRPYSYFNSEQAIKRDPDCVFLTYMAQDNPNETFKKRFGWQDISAVKNNRVYNDINSDLILRPGPRVVQGIKELYKRMYP